MSKTEEEFQQEIEREFKQTQAQFDNAKLTIATAGILVALSLNSRLTSSSPLLLKHSSYKWALVLDLLSLMAVLLSFVPREFSMKWIEKNLNRSELSAFQIFVLRHMFRNNTEHFSSFYPSLFVKYPNYLISAFNYSATILLFLSIYSFIYMVTRT